MKKYMLFILPFAIIMGIISCKNKDGKATKFNQLDKMNFLLGTWEQKLTEGTLIETWEKENDSTFKGTSFFIKEKDTLHAEYIELNQKDDSLFYIPVVKGQNDEKAITFKMTTETEKEFTFENPSHDYPQKIIYRNIDATNLSATISGIQLGKPNKESFLMKKK